MTNEQVVSQSRQKRSEWFFKHFSGSLSEERLKNFHGLDFYDYDSGYRKLVDVQLEAPDSTAVFAVEGVGRIDLRRYGRVGFTHEGVQNTLFLYCDPKTEKPTEFIAPFKDKTNGRSTYGGGRNLELSMHEIGQVILDFNMASNMECAYSDQSVCAMPLPENWLSVSIEAGEKILAK